MDTNATDNPYDFWPSLPRYADWRETYYLLHMWTQVVGKVKLSMNPHVNHWWQVPLYVNARGLSTAAMHYADRVFQLDFDFIDHQLYLRESTGQTLSIDLNSIGSVADFYEVLKARMESLRIWMKIWTTPVEVENPVPFERDDKYRRYDPEQANRFWRALVNADRVMQTFRSLFTGKCSPVHFFWGAFDLAVTRFSGRRAPPRDGPEFMREAYSHEVISHGFWPGSGPVLEAAFYAYAVPEPAGLKDARVEPVTAFYHRELGEFILPYEAVRRDPSPESALRAFIDSTYRQAATLGHWDREAVERAAVQENAL